MRVIASTFLPERNPPYTEGMSHQTDQAMHEAARAGRADQLAQMLAMDASLIDAKGMDARTPLHCAGTIPVAALLLDHGARIDARARRSRFDARTVAYWRITGRGAIPVGARREGGHLFGSGAGRFGAGGEISNGGSGLSEAPGRRGTGVSAAWSCTAWWHDLAVYAAFQFLSASDRSD